MAWGWRVCTAPRIGFCLGMLREECAPLIALVRPSRNLLSTLTPSQSCLSLRRKEIGRPRADAQGGLLALRCRFLVRQRQDVAGRSQGCSPPSSAQVYVKVARRCGSNTSKPWRPGTAHLACAAVLPVEDHTSPDPQGREGAARAYAPGQGDWALISPSSVDRLYNVPRCITLPCWCWPSDVLAYLVLVYLAISLRIGSVDLAVSPLLRGDRSSSLTSSSC